MAIQSRTDLEQALTAQAERLSKVQKAIADLRAAQAQAEPAVAPRPVVLVGPGFAPGREGQR